MLLSFINTFSPLPTLSFCSAVLIGLTCGVCVCLSVCVCVCEFRPAAVVVCLLAALHSNLEHSTVSFTTGAAEVTDETTAKRHSLCSPLFSLSLSLTLPFPQSLSLSLSLS